MRRPPSLLTLMGSTLGGIGFVLLAVQVARTLGGQALGGIGTGLLWVGFGLLAVGLIVLLMALMTDEPGTTNPGGDAPTAPAP